MTTSRFSAHAGTAVVVLLLISSILIAVPASAVPLIVPVPGSPTTTVKYLGGSPSLSASIVGTNEFSPGDDATITILVKNSGVSTLKQLNQSTMVPDDLPTTAKFAQIGLTSASDSIVIKTDPQNVNSLPAGGTGVPLTFKATITTNATEGDYELPVTIAYRYPTIQHQEVSTEFEYAYTDASVTLPVTVRIKPVVKIDVVEATPDPLSVGTEGYLDVKIRNAGPETGKTASAKLIRAGSSAVIPTDDTAFIGTFPSGNITECRFKVAVSKDATAQTYPVNIVVSYKNREGAVVTSKAETIGIPVYAKTSFGITSPVPTLEAGSKGTIMVTYRNNGNVTVYDAQARITPHTPVTSSDDIAFLGDLRPGESATAQYTITADGSAVPGTYTFDSKLRYRDAQDNSQESDTVDLTVQVLPAKAGTVMGISTTLFIGAVLILAIIAGLGFYLYRQKKSQQ